MAVWIAQRTRLFRWTRRNGNGHGSDDWDAVPIAARVGSREPAGDPDVSHDAEFRIFDTRLGAQLRKKPDHVRTARARATIQGVNNEPHHQHLNEAWYSSTGP